MALSDFRDTFSFQEAVELGPELVQLAEQLPASEELGLAFQLRKVMVDLPGAIAEDLLQDDSYTRRVEIARLAAMLDIIDKVYPALDTGKVRGRLEKLADRVATDRFGEQTPGAKKVYLAGAKPHAGPADPAPKPPLPPPAPPKPSPASVPVVPEDEHRPPAHDHPHHEPPHPPHPPHPDHDDEPAAMSTKVPVTPAVPPSPATPDDQEAHVHSDRGQ